MTQPIDVAALQGQVKHLVEDLRGQLARNADLRAELRQEWSAATEAKRVGVTFETWLEDVLDQAAVAWVLGYVFVRFCEDNGLVDRVWIGGPDDSAPVARAMQARQAYIIADPLKNDRDWLREAFKHLAGVRATSKIFDEHNPVWRFDISGEAAERLSDFFRRGAGLRSLQSDDLNTRFLGQLYQDLSAHARATYALLQTPEFVEEFILKRTLEPAVKEFGLANVKLIDPTCGSGHFLIGAFENLLRKWQEREPATAVDILVERALAQVTGVDINPFAVAIARFRLVVAALRATGRKNLNNSYPVRVATGDSLLDWGVTARHQGDLLAELDERPAFAYVTEDADLLAEYLRPGQYTVVVGNPPYITVKDKALNELYRGMYEACSGKYAMTVPFTQRFFELATRGDGDGDGAGLVGQITANSFMKREFGKKLINEYFAHQVELDEVIDTSGAYIPGHGTPTVILVGRNRMVSPRYSFTIRSVLGIRGEPSQPEVPAHGLVWTAIESQIDKPGSESEWISVSDFDRAQLAMHPWSLSGGGAADLMVNVNDTRTRLTQLIDQVGIVAVTAMDDVFFSPERVIQRLGLPGRSALTGDQIRDLEVLPGNAAVWPYEVTLVPVDLTSSPALERYVWINRRGLQRRVWFRQPIEAIPGMAWYEFGFISRDKLKSPLSIAFAVVSTHNHFVIDRVGSVCNRHAPVIKLPEGATEDDHLRLLGLLNSSTACFWLKQVSHNKGNEGYQSGIKTEMWERFYEFTGTKLQEFPLPSAYPLDRSRTLDQLAQRLAILTPATIAAEAAPTRGRLAAARAEYESVRAQMIALQEELDWEVYRLYGLLDDDLTAATPPELKLGERAFEIVLARSNADTQWFARHGSTPITELPAHWPDDYKQLVERRIAIIEADRNIGLIERPECKRRWATDGWDAMQQEALKNWLLDRLESPAVWRSDPLPLSVAQIADRVRHDDDFRHVLDLWVGNDQHDLTKSIGRLVADEFVPYLPVDRYKPSGLRKRAQWERTWALQRREDAGEKVDIAVPPKYASADFVKASYWRNRGKLDVPKERFIAYPKMGRDGDSTELLGWAGWDHLGQARALAAVYLDRKTQGGWRADRLLPLLAGLAELEPWLKQWHDELTAGYPGTPASFFTGLIDTELAALGSDRSTLAKLRGVEELA
ncbi:BREX-2 system adenine-specific DNA-methyltransferase PglX [Hamadaea sp. NPDC051192]|uniref:BREX-2 system adenine-specific DNA-methyltransferase PglX n=1 Tax=Hamadaea sp. NPDC051192 TaxID=3154940 RepID=UPI003432129B